MAAPTFEQNYMKFLEDTMNSCRDRRIPISDCISLLRFQTNELQKIHGDNPIFNNLRLIIFNAIKCDRERIPDLNCYDYLLQYLEVLKQQDLRIQWAIPRPEQSAPSVSYSPAIRYNTGNYLQAVEGDAGEETGMRLPYDTSGRFTVQRGEPEEIFRPLLENDANKWLDYYENEERTKLQQFLYKDVEGKDAERFFRTQEARDAYLLRNRVRIEEYLRKQRVKYHGLGNISNIFNLGQVEFSFESSKKGKESKKGKVSKKGKASKKH